jgi:hypothetical protein
MHCASLAEFCSNVVANVPRSPRGGGGRHIGIVDVAKRHDMSRRNRQNETMAVAIPLLRTIAELLRACAELGDKKFFVSDIPTQSTGQLDRRKLVEIFRAT